MPRRASLVSERGPSGIPRTGSCTGLPQPCRDFQSATDTCPICGLPTMLCARCSGMHASSPSPLQQVSCEADGLLELSQVASPRARRPPSNVVLGWAFSTDAGMRLQGGSRLGGSGVPPVVPSGGPPRDPVRSFGGSVGSAGGKGLAIDPWTNHV